MVTFPFPWTDYLGTGYSRLDHRSGGRGEAESPLAAGGKGAFVVERWERSCLFVLGGGAYLGVELAWRGATHWTMFLAGGICLCYLHWLDAGLRLPLPVCALLGAAGVSGLELGLGILCTQLLGIHVWDYSREWGNLAGYICPKYSVLWFFLCGWVLWAMRTLRHRLKVQIIG